MKSFNEISKNIASLQESLFDVEGDERVANSVKKDAANNFLSKCKGDYSIVSFKDGSVRVNGKLIITDLSTDKIYFNCRDFHGKLIIENCPKLETLEGPFLENITVFDGSITINQCPSLASLKGIPALIKGDLSITNCKKLKSIEGIDSVFGNFYWENNGKKYTEEQLKNKVHVIKKIFCSENEIEADVVEGLVTETFNNQWLQRLAAQLKKYPYKEHSWDDKAPLKYNKVDDLFKNWSRRYQGSGRLLDKISNDDVDVYDLGDEKDKKALSDVFYKAVSKDDNNVGDLFLVYDESLGEFIGGFGSVSKPRGTQAQGLSWFHIPHKDSQSDRVRPGSFYTKSEAKTYLLHFGYGYSVIVFGTGNSTGTGTDARYNIAQARPEARAGSINPGDVEQYKEIAAENIKRYKNLIAQAKLERKKSDDEGYGKLFDEYEKINLRIVKLTRVIAKNPDQFSSWEIESFFTWIRDTQRRNPNYKPWTKHPGTPYYGDNGLQYYFNSFVSAYIDGFGKTNSYFKDSDSKNYNRIENAAEGLKKALATADEKLKKFGV